MSTASMGDEGAAGSDAAQCGARVQVFNYHPRKCGEAPQLGEKQEVWLLDLSDLHEPFSAETVALELGWSRGQVRDRLAWFKAKQMLTADASGHRWTSFGRAVICELLIKESQGKKKSGG